MEAKPLIMIVADVFQLEGRGIVLTGFQEEGHAALARKGVSIEVHTPSGVTYSNVIADIEYFRGRMTDEPSKLFSLALVTPMASQDLPRGTELRYAGSTDGGMD